MAKSTKSSGKVARATIAVRACVGLEVCARWLPDPATERQPPGTNWVVVTDKNGRRRLRMGWATSGNR